MNSTNKEFAKKKLRFYETKVRELLRSGEGDKLENLF
jgi:hypothetical protein